MEIPKAPANMVAAQPAQAYSAPPHNMSPVGPGHTQFGTHPGAKHPNTASGDPISYGQYMLMMILVSIPIVNLVLLIKWGFIGEGNPNKRNFAKAMLTFMVAAVVLSILFSIITALSISRMYY